MGATDKDAWAVVYEALRAHELELNRATAAFEHALLAPLTLLNGGAAAAWLTFVGDRQDFGMEAGWRVWGPALAWGVGLGLAVWAIRTGWERQRRYATGERWRREALEMMWLRPSAAAASDPTTVLTTLALDNYYGGSDELSKAVDYVRTGSTSEKKAACRLRKNDKKAQERQRRQRAQKPVPSPAGRTTHVATPMADAADAELLRPAS